MTYAYDSHVPYKILILGNMIQQSLANLLSHMLAGELTCRDSWIKCHYIKVD